MVSVVPQEYRGRPQSLLKHRVLREYVNSWALKVGSVSAKLNRAIDLWYVDCFAGPWGTGRDDLQDTSVAIGVRALESAVSIWQEKGHQVSGSAIFIGKNEKAADQLSRFIDANPSPVNRTVMVGTFGDRVLEIEGKLRKDPAFIFVDPTGWKGADMEYIARLANERWRDVMINVMYEHLNRWVNDPREFLREQMRGFFGLADAELAANLGKSDLIEFYRQRLKSACGLKYAADVAIPFLDKQRTYFHLVVGGNHSKVLEVLRSVEDMIVGDEAARLREAVKSEKEASSGQTAFAGLLSSPNPHQKDRRFVELRESDIPGALAHIAAVLKHRAHRYDEVWPGALERFHLTKKMLGQLIVESERFHIQGKKARQRGLRDDHILSLAASPDPIK